MNRTSPWPARFLACPAGLALASAVVAGAGAAHAGVLNVPADYSSIQDAVDAAADGDEVVVADGVYTDEVSIFDKSITLRSASDNPALCIIDPFGTGVALLGSDTEAEVRGFTIRNCLRAIEINGDASAAISNCVLEGCTIGGVFMNGDSMTMTDCVIQNNSGAGVGAGLNVTAGNVVVRRTTIRNNAIGGASAFGGGVHVAGMVDFVMVDCEVLDNVASGPGLARGGGLYVYAGAASRIVVSSSRFEGNESDERGGGIYIEFGSAVLDNLHVMNNVSGAGGGIFLDNLGGPPNSYLLTNSVVAKNTATNGSGGGIRQTQDSSLTVINATIMGNSSSAGGGGVANGPNSTADFANCIIGNNAPNDLAGAGTTTVIYSNVSDGFPGEGNISTPPLFVNPAAGDYRLSPNSPCIDAGSMLAYRGPALDLAGNARAVDDPDTENTGFALDHGAIDMGAYERQPANPCPADFNGDGVIDGSDLGVLLGAWGFCPAG